MLLGALVRLRKLKVTTSSPRDVPRLRKRIEYMRVKELLDLSLILTLKVHPLRYPAKSLGLMWPILGLITGFIRPM
jgi:hypothetical protein